jgi:hypothetical protein
VIALCLTNRAVARVNGALELLERPGPDIERLRTVVQRLDEAEDEFREAVRLDPANAQINERLQTLHGLQDRLFPLIGRPPRRSRGG